MNVDPAASMRCWAVDVEIGGAVHTIPALPAADWWPVLAGETPPFDLLPAGHDIDDLLIDGKIDSGELASAFRDAIEQACGRSQEEAVTIAAVAAGAWSWVGGRMALAGFRWDVMPISAALDALHAIFMEHLNDEGRKKYEALLAQAGPKQLDRAAAISEFEELAGPRPAPAPLRSSAAPSGSPPPRTRQPSQPPRRRGPSGAPSLPPAPPDRSDPAARSGPLPA